LLLKLNLKYQLEMKTNEHRFLLRVLITGLFSFSLAGVPLLNAQEDDDEIFDLSPFTITSDEDTGYAATNTLAGTRLRSDLKDLAGAVQVVTEEFLEDTGSTNLEDLFLYTTNTEVSGPDGNFGNNGADRRDPNGSARVRGLAEPDRTRNFFLSDIGLDTYNLDRVTIAKGPNAILFGLGSPAGLVNSNLKQARFEDTTEIKLRYGSWDAHREILDVNRVFIEDVLAFRIIGLNNQNKFKQKPSFEDEQRLYGAMLFKPFENTTIRANLEIGSRNASRPFIITPSSNIPDWVANGMQTNPDPGASSGWSIVASNRGPAYVFDSPSATQATLGFDSGPATTGPDGIRRFHFTWSNREDANAAVSNAVLSDEDDWVFDFRNNTLTGHENTSFSSFDAANITLEQQFSQNSGVEIAYDKQNSKDGWLDRAANNVSVDASEYFGYFFEVEDDGTPILIPNPRVGRPYRHGNDNFANGNSQREAFRITGYYDLDLRDHDKLSWLGHHVFTGLYSDQSREVYEQSDSYGIVSAGEVERVLEANRNRGYSTASYDRLARNYRYLGPRITGTQPTAASRGPSSPNPRIQEISAVMYDSTADPIFDGHNGAYRQIDGSPLVLNPVNNASIDRQEIESIALTAQSYTVAHEVL
jgi:outer membrane receptor protein involved in Fe transport